MKRLDRYILKELVVPILIGTVVIALLFMGNEFIAIFKNFQLSHIPLLAVFQLVLFKMPYWMSLTLPTGMAMGASLAFSRLARESEITAMRAAGITLRRMVLPVAVVGALVAIGNFLIVDRVLPPAALAARRLATEMSLLAAAPQFKSDVMLKIDRYTARFGTVQRTRQGILLTDVLIIENPQPGEWVIYSSDTGTYADGIWRINKPYIRVLRGVTLVSGRSEDEIVINERLQIADIFAAPADEEATVADLAGSIKAGRAAQRDTTELEVALQTKFSVPAACLVFAIAGAVFAVRFARAGPFIGVLVSLGLVVTYYNAHIICTEIVGRNGWLGPVAAVWTPNVLMIVISILVARKLA